jgi:hypothetical protein
MGIPFEEALASSEVAFTHIFEGIPTSILTGRLIKDPRYLTLPVTTVAIDFEFAKFSLDYRGVERHRLERITTRDLVKYPVTMCEWGDGSHLLVDGTHRYVRAALWGRTRIRARLVPITFWKEYEIVDAPPLPEHILLKMHSGIL